MTNSPCSTTWTRSIAEAAALVKPFRTTLRVPSRSFTPRYERLRARLPLPIRGTSKHRINDPSRKTAREFRNSRDAIRPLRSCIRRVPRPISLENCRKLRGETTSGVPARTLREVVESVSRRFPSRPIGIGKVFLRGEKLRSISSRFKANCNLGLSLRGT